MRSRHTRYILNAVMDALPLLLAVLALWAAGLVLAVTLCLAAGRADRAAARGRWLAPVRS